MVQVQMQTSFGAPKPSAHCDMKVSGHGSSEKLLQGSSVASMHPVVCPQGSGMAGLSAGLGLPL
jgi:hypothetical protein